MDDHHLATEAVFVLHQDHAVDRDQHREGMVDVVEGTTTGSDEEATHEAEALRAGIEVGATLVADLQGATLDGDEALFQREAVDVEGAPAMTAIATIPQRVAHGAGTEADDEDRVSTNRRIKHAKIPLGTVI